MTIYPKGKFKNYKLKVNYTHLVFFQITPYNTFFIHTLIFFLCLKTLH